jgi:hypothetical protein
MNFKPLALVGALLVALVAAPAHAAFTGAYDVSQWTTAGSGNGTAVTSSDGATLTLTSADYTVDDSPGATTLTYSITLAADTTITFDWSYVSDDDSSTSDPFGYAVNGVETQLSQDGVAGFVAQGGSVTIALSKGDTFSFESGSVDSIFGASTASVSAFSAVGAVPEPASVASLLVGMTLLAGLARRRRKD